MFPVLAMPAFLLTRVKQHVTDDDTCWAARYRFSLARLCKLSLPVVAARRAPRCYIMPVRTRSYGERSSDAHTPRDGALIILRNTCAPCAVYGA